MDILSQFLKHWPKIYTCTTSIAQNLNYNLILIILLVSVFYGSSLTAFGIKKNNKYNSFNRISNTNSNSNSNSNRNSNSNSNTSNSNK